MNSTIPLAELLRPQSLGDYVGQPHLVGSDGIVTKLIKSQTLPSLIFWGPPGCGKTTLAYLIAANINAHFEALSAVGTNLDGIRKILGESLERLSSFQQRTILFIDEIHRFNKAQQDVFLPHVEKGTIILIGATTENPSYEVIGPLLSRCRVLVLRQLSTVELVKIMNNGLQKLNRSINSEARAFLQEAVNGDARKLLTTLEVAAAITQEENFTVITIEQALQKKQLLYDRVGEEHYETISAFIKSMRASQPDAAVYYLARMVEGGEDSLFIARRMVIFASEDIGMAVPTALVVANEVFKACEVIGYPDCAINLVHGVVYLASCKKDRSAYNALQEAIHDVQKHGNLPIPLNIRNSPTTFMKELGFGKGYQKYTTQSFLPEKLKNKRYYNCKTQDM